MSLAENPCYTLLHPSADTETVSEQKMKEDLMQSDPKVKLAALKRIIRNIVNGERIPASMLMTIIQYVMPVQDNTIKKLLLIFWEVVPKISPNDGKLLHEMILVCDAYRKDLQHPNEFIRGCTLRFLCKLKQHELLEPLMPSILQCLEHRHSYVRRNAVLAIFTIYKNFDFLIPDAPQKILTFLNAEQDASCKRNAFMMLLHASQSTALEYLYDCIDQVGSFGEIMQLIIVELIYKVCWAHPHERARFIRCIYGLLDSNTVAPAVRYEAANTLTTLSSAPTAIKAVANCYIDLILKESDNNIKLIVLQRLSALRLVGSSGGGGPGGICDGNSAAEKTMQGQLMDVLRVLAASDLEVRRGALRLGLELVTARNVDDFVALIKKELIKAFHAEGAAAANTTFAGNTVAAAASAGGADLSKTKSGGGVSSNQSAAAAAEERAYRWHLVHTLHVTVTRHPHVLPAVLPTLCEEVLTFCEAGSEASLLVTNSALANLHNTSGPGKSGANGGAGGQSGGAAAAASALALASADLIGDGSGCGSGGGGGSAADEVCRMIRETIHRFPDHHALIIGQLLEHCERIRNREVLRHVIWLLGEFAVTQEQIYTFMTLIRQMLGELPLVDNELRRLAGDDQQQQQSGGDAKQDGGGESALLAADGGLSLTQSAQSHRITADGTYASQSALTSAHSNAAAASGQSGGAAAVVERPLLAAALFHHADFLLGTVLSVALVKLYCRLAALIDKSQSKRGGSTSGGTSHSLRVFAGEAMLIQASLLHVAHAWPQLNTHSNLPPANPDNLSRIWTCLRSLSERPPQLLYAFHRLCRLKLDSSLRNSFSAGSATTAKSSANPKTTAAATEFEADPFAAALIGADSAMSTATTTTTDDSSSANKIAKELAAAAAANRRHVRRAQADQPVQFLQLFAGSSAANQNSAGLDQLDLTLNQALSSSGGSGASGSHRGDATPAGGSSATSGGSGGGALDRRRGGQSKLAKVHQLTGFSDPVYAEAYVFVNQYDIGLDVFVVNLTNDTLQSLTLELATLGDLRLVEKPAPITLAPHDFANITASIKVSSSEDGIIFGNIVYDVHGAAGEANCVVLNDIHIDILEYIKPASLARAAFQRMWRMFEWENKVTVNTKIQDAHVYLEHIIRHTNLRCLTPVEARAGSHCDYLCVTLYAKSVFGEHVLANMCVERQQYHGGSAAAANQNQAGGGAAVLIGHMRIRAKSQGMAVTMGEKVSLAQKLTPDADTLEKVRLETERMDALMIDVSAAVAGKKEGTTRREDDADSDKEVAAN